VLAAPPPPQIPAEARTINLHGVVFDAVCDIEPVREANGRLAEFAPQEHYARAATTRLNRWGTGPFCRFSIPRGWAGAAGVYAILLDGQLRYIGECFDLERRFNIGYGNIQPINCFVGGQSTNCKVNSFILQAAKAGARVSLFFYRTDDYKRVERELIAALRPAWNAR
jgi:hypothetical protein